MKELLNLAKLAAISAGNEILKHYDSYQIRIKDDKSPVTTADLVANEIIIEILSKSGIKICSEEQILTDNVSEFWLVDPLDGTKEFIDKNGEFCVCIALIKDEKPTLGVIFIPTTNELFYADKNEAFKEILEPNGKTKSTTNLNQTKQSQNIIYTSRRGKNKTANFIASKIGFNPFASGSAIKYCRLAELGGIYVRFSPSSIWDNAAGEAIISAVNAKVFNAKTKQEIRYNLKNLKSPHFIALSEEFINLKDEILEISSQI